MSGGVGPTADIQLPREEEEQEQKLEHDHHPITKSKNQPPPTSSSAARKGGGTTFLTFRQLNALAVILVSATSGMVSPLDLSFVFFSAVYIYFLSKVAFPNLGPAAEPRVFDPKNRVLRLYVLAGAVVGLILPIAYIFEGILEGDKEGIMAAAPHVFLLASQVFMEGVFSDRFSTPIRAFVPVAFNARRMFTLEEWLRTEVMKVDVGGTTARRLYVGRALAVANMGFWGFNLFGFLLPVYLPKALKRYYSNSSESGAAAAAVGNDDKPKEN